MPRTAKDNELIRATRREEIFLAAGRVFAKKGFAATKIADIAAEAKLSHGLLYHYYRSKEEVYTALFDEILKRKPELDAQLATIPRAIDRLEHRIAYWLTKSAERPELTVMVTQALVSDNLPSAARQHFLTYSRDTYVSLVSDVAQAQADGDATRAVPTEELATAIMSLVRGLATMRFVRAAAFSGQVHLEMGPELALVSARTVLRLLAIAPEARAESPRAPSPQPAPSGRGMRAAPSSPRSGAGVGANKKKLKKEKSRAA